MPTKPMPTKPTRKQTPSQTIGPFFAQGLTAAQNGYDFDSIIGNTISGAGQAIRVQGQVLDGEGMPVGDALIEIWQADSQGQYDQVNFTGLARCGTNFSDESNYLFETIKPGSCGDKQAPYITLILFMRGLTSHAFTRLYFDDEAQANAEDLVLQQLPDDRRASLLAKRDESDESAEGLAYRFDIHMQGDDETVFFDI